MKHIVGKFLFAVLFFVLFVGCKEHDSPNCRDDNPMTICSPDSDEIGDLVYVLQEWCWSGRGTISSDEQFIDVQDGTIKRTLTRVERIDCLSTQTFTSSYLIKKCVQGQVYRPLPVNDCRGAVGGTADNNWGAEKFQWCTADTFLCNRTGSYSDQADPTKSPAAISCAADNFNGISWKMEFPYPVDTHYKTIESSNNIIDNHPELPVGAGNEIWINSSISNDPMLANSRQINLDNTYISVKFLKTSGHYVWCRGELY